MYDWRARSLQAEAQRDKAVELLKECLEMYETPGRIKTKIEQFLKENNLMEPANGT